MAIEWTTPKTDWAVTDKFNVTDFNRIKNNMIWLHQRSIEIWGAIYNIIPIRTEYDQNLNDDYKRFWNVFDFNALEDNLDTINAHTAIRDYGTKKTYYENGVFIRFDELNRIESAQLDLYRRFSEVAPSYKTLPIRMNHPYYPFKLPMRSNPRPAKANMPVRLPQKLGGDKQFKQLAP